MTTTMSISKFVPNEQQRAVFEWAERDTGSLNLIANAGCGKSETAVQLVKRLTGKVFVGAYSKSIAVELQNRIGVRPGVVAGTIHSIGYYYWRKIQTIHTKPDKYKVRTIAKRHRPGDKHSVSVICDAVSYAKQLGFGLKGVGDYTQPKMWQDLFDYYDLWDEVPPAVTQPEIIQSCMEVYDESLEQCMDTANPAFDFDDMVLAPLYFSESPAAEYDWVIVDECQDASAIRRKLAQFILKPGGRMLSIGDPNQSIMGFSGATNDSMEIIKQEMNAKELPLSVTYRCPKRVVELAQKWVPSITAHESAPDGEVFSINHREFLRYGFKPTDVILCRTKRPLIGIAKVLRKRGVECFVEGVNYQGMIGLASKWGEDISVGDMLDKLQEYTDGEVVRLTAEGKEEKAEEANEKFQMIWDFTDGVKMTDPVYRLLDRIDQLLNFTADDREVLRLCSIHVAKGKEWDRVFLVGRNLYMPSKYAKQDWELQQEDNLAYVAVTRSKRVLVEVNVPVKPRGEGPWWEE